MAPMCPRKGPCMIRTLSKILALASLGCLISLSLVLAAPADQHLAQAPEASLTVITGKVIDVHLDGTATLQTQDGQVYHVPPYQMRGERLRWGERATCGLTHGKLLCERE
jgi:hypothetical protein